jgi:hypothetical protein
VKGNGKRKVFESGFGMDAAVVVAVSRRMRRGKEKKNTAVVVAVSRRMRRGKEKKKKMEK